MHLRKSSNLVVQLLAWLFALSPAMSWAQSSPQQFAEQKTWS